MEVFKCDRCGKPIEIEKVKEVSKIQCHHCNKKFMVSKSSRNKSIFIMTFVVILLSFSITLISSIFNLDPMLTLIPFIFISIFLNQYILFYMAKFKQIDYVEDKDDN